MRQRGNKNLSFPPAFRDLSEKLLVKYSQLYKLGKSALIFPILSCLTLKVAIKATKMAFNGKGLRVGISYHDFWVVPIGT